MAEDDLDRASLLAFIEGQTKKLKKADLEELSPVKLHRAVAALADLTDETPPDTGSTVFVSAWKRADQCHHFWGPTVGQERFCTKCQLPRHALAPDEDVSPTRRRT